MQFVVLLWQQRTRCMQLCTRSDLAMKIDRVDIYNVHNPFNHPFQTSFTKFVNRDALLVKVYSEGYVGWGECKAFYGPFYNPEDNGTVLHVLKNIIIPAILHEDIAGPKEFIEKFNFIKANRLAKAAIENALWDLMTQLYGKIPQNPARRHTGRN